MAIVVRNDSNTDIRLSGGGNDRLIKPGQVITLTDDEYEKIPFSKRGFGKVLAINPEEASSETLRNLLDFYVNDNNEYVIRYNGLAPQGVATSSPTWIIKRFSYSSFGDTASHISDIQVLSNVAWDDRESLPWTA